MTKNNKVKKQIKPFNKDKTNYKCDVCNSYYFNSSTLKKHLSSQKHKNKENNIIKLVKPKKIYKCDLCNKPITQIIGLSDITHPMYI
jgi:hypothetical protein